MDNLHSEQYLILLMVSQLAMGRIHVQPFNFPRTAIVGQKISALCGTTSSGSEQLAFTWMKDGRDVDSNRVKVNTLDGISNIIFNELNEEDEGNYTCRVTSPRSGSDSYTAPLHVLVPARWEQRPQAQHQALEGTNVVLTCKGSGRPPPTTVWSGPRLVNESSLVFPKLSRGDQGVYKCRVSNNVGPELEAATFLAVNVPAKFDDKFSVLTVRRGESVTMKCQVRGDKPLSIAWSKDKKLLDLDKTTGLEKFEQENEEGLVSELMVRSATRTDGALYTCFAKNEHGVDERNVKLSVVEVPGPPLDVREDETFSKTISLTWKGSYTGNSPITRYIVQYWRERGGVAHRLHEETVPSARTRFELKGLKPGTTYAVSIIAENEVGQGEPSEPITVTTAEEDPSGPPTDVKVEAKGSGAILASWNAPPREYWNGELKGYRVGYKAVDSSSKQFSFKTVDINPASNNTHEYLLTNLLKSTRYAIVVKAFNSAGTGPPSQELMVRTLDGEVPFPPPLALAAATDTSISVRWGDSPPPKTGSSVTGFTIHYKKDEHSLEWFQIPIVSPALNRYTVTGLERGSTYRVYLRASNQYGSGDPSEVISVKTTNNGMLDGLPFYLDLAVVIPAAACFLSFLVIITVIAVFIHKVRQRRRLEKAIHGSKGQYGYHTGTVPRNHPAEKPNYSTLPHQEMRTFDPASLKDRPLPQHPSLTKKSPRLYDTAE